jgi:xanthine dehydrogenase YagS FAD-binding subunit
MKPFSYVEAATAAEAIRTVVSAPGAAFFAGGTTLVDLMKLDVLAPDTLVDITQLPLDTVEVDAAGAHIGANVRNSDLAWHLAIRERYPALSEALLAGASTQLRNMATTAGNLMQRTRCAYFRDTSAACNKRAPGSGCDAMSGYNRGHAVLGTSDKCIATHPSDMGVALTILDATVRTLRPDGSTRAIPFVDFYLLPGQTPERETPLERGELITHVDLPVLPAARRSHYLKVRDRASYEFALASAAVLLDVRDGVIQMARIALGGVATKPWRSPEAERTLQGQQPGAEVFRAAAESALAGATPRQYNAFKIELAKRTLVHALVELVTRPALGGSKA